MSVRKWVVAVLVLCSVSILGSAVLAQQQEVSARPGFGINWWVILETVIYAVIGIILSLAAYKVYDLLTPFSLNKELSEDQNIAVGILLGSIFIGIAIIIAASIS